jgi:extracellular factor (EF) 3-hydroxypalmitic acid methyl ester biosynthesis protein
MNPLAFLTDGDWQALRAHRQQMKYERDETIVREGTATPGVMVILSGSARVQQRRDGLLITLVRMGPGEIFGEMSMLEDTVASATVIADEPTSVELFSRGEVDALLQSDPGFSARFYRSIAVHLSRRLRDRSHLFSQLDAQALVQTTRQHATRFGQITSRQIPRDLVAGVMAFDVALQAIDRGDTASGPSSGAARAVATTCDRLLAQLERALSPEALFEAGYNDLGSFRDPATLASGIGGYVLRQTFSWLMTAATLARTYMRPRGFAEDHETLAMIHDDDPDGDGVVGPLIDRWFLSRPVCRFRRASRERARAFLRRVSAEANGARVSAAVLASGAAVEAIATLAEPGAAGLLLTCIDLDHQALAAGARAAEELGVADRVALVPGNVVPPEPEAVPSLGHHHAAYALGLFEYLSDDECARVLDWAHGALLPRGVLLIATLASGSPDQLFMEHLLEWKVTPRSEDELAALFARSRFSAAPSLERDETGTGLYAVVTKKV